MASRKQLYHPEEIKEKIKTSQLINRLQDNGLADKEFLTPGQVASINSLLDRVVPRLKNVEVSGDPENPINVITRIEIVSPK